MTEGIGLVREVATAVRGGGVILHPAHQQAMEENSAKVDQYLAAVKAEMKQAPIDLAAEGIAQVTYAELSSLSAIQLADIVLDMKGALQGAKYDPATGWYAARLESERILRNVVKLNLDRSVGA